MSNYRSSWDSCRARTKWRWKQWERRRRFYDAVVGKVARVVVVNLHQLQVISASVSKTDPQGCSGAGAVSEQGIVAGGKNETESASGSGASDRDPGSAGKAALGTEEQDQEPAGNANSAYLNQFYNRIKERRGHGKAKIALATKMVKIVYDTLKNNWVFEDFPTLALTAQPSPTIIE